MRYAESCLDNGLVCRSVLRPVRSTYRIRLSPVCLVYEDAKNSLTLVLSSRRLVDAECHCERDQVRSFPWIYSLVRDLLHQLNVGRYSQLPTFN